MERWKQADDLMEYGIVVHWTFGTPEQLEPVPMYK